MTRETLEVAFVLVFLAVVLALAAIHDRSMRRRDAGRTAPLNTLRAIAKDSHHRLSVARDMRDQAVVENIGLLHQLHEARARITSLEAEPSAAEVAAVEQFAATAFRGPFGGQQL